MPMVVDYAHRWAALAGRAQTAGVDAVLIGPGADLQYFAGRSVGSHERLTVLVIAPTAEPLLLLPALERAGWAGSPIETLGVPIRTWSDGGDPYAAAAALLPEGARRLAVDDYLPAVHALGLQAAVPGSELALAGGMIGELRMRKQAGEVAELASVGAAIDRVHRRIGQWLRVGRTEAEVAADIAAAMIAEGHARADFVIVGSGPNGAGPHHEATDRVVQPGESVVVDIGGPNAAGYFSDCTRTYLLAGPVADPEFEQVYDVVLRAQRAAIAAVAPGVTAQSVDAAARSVVERAGYGEHFITRTGHGIGLEVHEQPYIVHGNDQRLELGMAFSVEPGVYLAGRFGVRIEDIVVVGPEGAVPMNSAPTELTVVGHHA